MVIGEISEFSRNPRNLLALSGCFAEQREPGSVSDARDYSGVASELVETRERGHGRVETRRYRTLGDLSGVPRSALWEGLDMIGMVESHRGIDGKCSREYRFYIGRIGTDAARFARAVRGHRGIENDRHGSPDVAFREDDARIRQPQARENFAVLRHIALTRWKNDAQTKPGIQNKRLKAGWHERYRAQWLFDQTACAARAPSH